MCHDTCLTCQTPQDPATCLSCERNRRLNGVAPSTCVGSDDTCEGNSYYDESLGQCTGINPRQVADNVSMLLQYVPPVVHCVLVLSTLTALLVLMGHTSVTQLID